MASPTLAYKPAASPTFFHHQFLRDAKMTDDTLVLSTSKLTVKFGLTNGDKQLYFKVVDFLDRETTFRFSNEEWRFLLSKRFQRFLSDILESFGDKNGFVLKKENDVLGKWEICQKADTVKGKLCYSLQPKGMNLAIEIDEHEEQPLIYFNNRKQSTNSVFMTISTWNYFKKNRKKMFDFLFEESKIISK